MRAVVQRVSRAAVTVEGSVVGEINAGLLVLLGVAEGDSLAQAHFLADKIAGLRIFNDPAGKFNVAVTEMAGSVLVVSQFTLLADTRKGRRPSFVHAAAPELAAPLVEECCARLRSHGLTVATGQFGAHMEVSLVNHGPVTIMLDTDDQARPRRSAD